MLAAEFAAVALAALALVRVLQLDTSRPGIMIVTFLPWFLLPIYLLFGIGIGARRWRLIALTGLLIFGHVNWVSADLASDSESSAAARSAPQLKVLTANTLARNEQLIELLDVVLSQDADIVALQEMGWRERSRLSNHRLVDNYPHRFADRELGIVLLSRLPIENASTWGRGFPRITVSVEEVSVDVVAIHTATPLWNTELWKADLAFLNESAKSHNGRLVLMGDFNSTMQHRQFRDLLSQANLTDSHLRRGSGWGATWPRRFLLGPQLRLDHVLTSAGLEPLTHSRLSGPGSDHRPVFSTIAVLPDVTS